ncbi:hypothetical protein KGQ19_00725 [Catenulispora sp. NL8]|uniref:NAD(+)--protein-arginine ADP-ribosyltransferase n=1 Tax=Catenulispora pinistramenti TaxID=2705254 RepID=A0ABS5KH07_9ACTN|nr:ADP-ribosyltransferase domain-containing protein [Catenulispora pinistramenti]MBS2545383.1 hypothetical protein [Catenulispora pinistramenti]
MGLLDDVGGVLDDLNPLHLIDALNNAIGHSTADILQFLGITDPAVDPDGIRRVAAVWKNLADAIGAAGFAANQSTADMTLKGQVDIAFGDRAGQVQSVASQVEGALYKGHDGLVKLADQAHDLISQVGVLAAQIAEFEVAGLALSLLTGPLSDAAAALASGTRARQIVEVFAELEAMVVRAGKMIEDLCAEIAGLGRILKALESVGKVAFSGAKNAAAFDLMFNPGHLVNPDKLTGDLALGAGGEVGFTALGRGLGALRGALGELGLDGAAGDTADLFGPEVDQVLTDLDHDPATAGLASGPGGPNQVDPAALKAFADSYYAYDADLKSVQDFISLNPDFAHADPELLTAVKGYTGNAFYRAMNDALRSEDPARTAPWANHVEVINAGLDQLPPYEGSVFRGIRVFDDAEAATIAAKYEPGQVITENAFMSTGVGHGFSGKVQLEVESLTGRDIKPISHVPGEGEILFKAGTKFEVVSRAQDASGTWHIQLKETS